MKQVIVFSFFCALFLSSGCKGGRGGDPNTDTPGGPNGVFAQADVQSPSGPHPAAVPGESLPLEPGTRVAVRVDSYHSSPTGHPDKFEGTLAKPIVLDGKEVASIGSVVTGRVEMNGNLAILDLDTIKTAGHTFTVRSALAPNSPDGQKTAAAVLSAPKLSAQTDGLTRGKIVDFEEIQSKD